MEEGNDEFGKGVVVGDVTLNDKDVELIARVVDGIGVLLDKGL